MHDRWQGSARDERSDYGQESGEYREDERGIKTQGRTRAEMDRREESRGGSRQGDWQGYVVPYRYYGPGYRGVGYYSVMYQGSDGEPGQGDQSAFSGQGSRSGRGGYAGKGPKGYRRSDERIREEVSDRLTANDELDASGIEVQVRDCEVTLTGTVEDRWMKRLAEDLAERVMGVRDVMNQIRVQGEQESDTRSGSSTGRASRTGTEPMTGSEDPTPNGKRRPQPAGSR